MAAGRFENAINTSHEVLSFVDVYPPNQEVKRLVAIDGTVTADRSASVRRRCTVTCVDPDGTWTPTDPTSALMPLGSEIRPYRGVKYPDGAVEIKPLGVFRISSTQVQETSSEFTISLEAFDRSRTIQRDVFSDPYLIEGGTNVVAAIQALAMRTFPEIEFISMTSSTVTTAPRLYEVNDDPWEVMTDLSKSLGAEIYFDVEGRLVLGPQSQTSPSTLYIEGQGCMLLGVDRTFSDDNPGYNGVIVEAESHADEAPPVRAVVWDDNPVSPTYYLGPYGKFPMHHVDKVVKTEEEAEAVGKQMLDQILGAATSLSVTGLVDPSLECGKLIQVRRARSKVDGTYSVENFTVPLRASSTQSIGLRSVEVSA